MHKLVAQPQDLFFHADGARLRYRDSGRGSALLLLHGWTLDLDMWEPQALDLANEYRVVRVDRRGFGLSSGKPSIERDIADVASLCAHLELQRVTLVGMSQGARVALGAASAWPDRIARLVLDGAPSINPADAAERARELPFEHYRQLAKTTGMEAFRREWSQHPLSTLRTTHGKARVLLTALIARYPGHDLLAPAFPSPTPAIPIVLASLQQPTLVIHGQYDLDTRRRWAAGYAEQIPHAHSTEIADAGHLCNLDNSAQYSHQLKRFLAE